jgi:hypothetical protein
MSSVTAADQLVELAPIASFINRQLKPHNVRAEVSWVNHLVQIRLEALEVPSQNLVTLLQKRLPELRSPHLRKVQVVGQRLGDQAPAWSRNVWLNTQAIPEATYQPKAQAKPPLKTQPHSQTKPQAKAPAQSQTKPQAKAPLNPQPKNPSKFTVPALELPNLEFPNLELPNLKFPSLELPNLDLTVSIANISQTLFHFFGRSFLWVVSLVLVSIWGGMTLVPLLLPLHLQLLKQFDFSTTIGIVASCVFGVGLLPLLVKSQWTGISGRFESGKGLGLIGLSIGSLLPLPFLLFVLSCAGMAKNASWYVSRASWGVIVAAIVALGLMGYGFWKILSVQSTQRGKQLLGLVTLAVMTVAIWVAVGMGGIVGGQVVWQSIGLTLLPIFIPLQMVYWCHIRETVERDRWKIIYAIGIGLLPWIAIPAYYYWVVWHNQ